MTTAANPVYQQKYDDNNGADDETSIEGSVISNKFIETQVFSQFIG